MSNLCYLSIYLSTYTYLQGHRSLLRDRETERDRERQRDRDNDGRASFLPLWPLNNIFHFDPNHSFSGFFCVLPHFPHKLYIFGPTFFQTQFFYNIISLPIHLFLEIRKCESLFLMRGIYQFHRCFGGQLTMSTWLYIYISPNLSLALSAYMWVNFWTSACEIDKLIDLSSLRQIDGWKQNETEAEWDR